MIQFQALQRLASMSTRDMLRDRLTGIAPAFLFVWLLLLYFLISVMLPGVATTPALHPLRHALPSILMTGVAATAFMATTVPLVSMRERGLLRLLGTTPLKKSTFLVAQLPGRVVLVFLQAVVVWFIAYFAGYTDMGMHSLRMLGTLGIGTAMLLACAFLLAGRGRSAESSHHLMVTLAMGAMMCSGTFLPIPKGMLPGFIEALPNVLPTTWFASALTPDLTGADSFLPVFTLWAMMLCVTAAAGIIALRRFEWDREEASIGRSSHRQKPWKVRA